MNMDGHRKQAARKANNLHSTICELMSEVDDLKRQTPESKHDQGDTIFLLCDEAQSTIAQIRSHTEEAIDQMRDTGVIG